VSELRPVAPGVSLLRAPNAGLMTGSGTNTYLLGQRDVVVVDPGSADANFVALILSVLRTWQARLAAVWLTHAHPDHAGNVGALCAATGAPLLAWHSPNQVYPVDDLPKPARAAKHGDAITVDDSSYQVLHTPGHASDHLCFYRSLDGLLLSGDLINQGNTVVIARPDGDMRQYLASLQLIRELSPIRILPGHGEPVEGAALYVESYIRHRRMREAQLLDVLGEEWLSPYDCLARLYPALGHGLGAVALQQIDAHLALLHEDGVVRRDDVLGLYQRVSG